MFRFYYYKLSLWVGIGSLALLSSCVKVESNRYFCDENTTTMIGLSGVGVNVKFVGTSNSKVDSLLYSHHHVGAPYVVKVFFDGHSSYFSNFEVNSGQVAFERGGASKEKTLLKNIKEVAVHRSQQGELVKRETHVVEISQSLDPKNETRFKLELTGKISLDGRLQDFRYACEVKHKLFSDSGLALTN